MNKREKFLFILLAAAVILFGGFKVLIEPALTSFSVKGVELLKLSQEKKASQKTVDNLKTLSDSNMELENTIKSTVTPFFPELKNDKVHIWIQDLAVKSGVEFTVLNMAQPVTVQVTNPIPTYKALIYPSSGFVENINNIKNGKPIIQNNEADTKKPDTTKSSNQNSIPNDLIEMMVVSVQFNGAYEQGIALLDQIKNSGRISRVTSFTINKTETGFDTKIVIECFGTKKLTLDDVLSKNSLQTPAGKLNPFA